MDPFHLKFDTAFGSLRSAELKSQYHHWRTNFRSSKRPMRQNALMEFLMLKYFTYLFYK